jgi:hypothetical protein
MRSRSRVLGHVDLWRRFRSLCRFDGGLILPTVLSDVVEDFLHRSSIQEKLARKA